MVKLLTIEMDEAIPRKEEEMVNISNPYYRKIMSKPVKTIYAKDLKKHIIFDGHHRAYLRKKLGMKTIKVNCVGYQEQTEIIKGVPQIKWGTGSVIKYA